jgi:tetratricopeptide (TPR) repeat protein
VSGAAPPHGWAAFDLILCRNVLIYFDTATADSVISSLEGALRPSGTLMLGAADALCRGAARLQSLGLVAPPRPASARSARVLRRPLGRAGRPDAAPRPRDPAPLPRDPAPGADPSSPKADFLRGLAELEASNPEAAVAALRRTLYAEPTFGVAAFQLGRSYEALGDQDAARRAYEQALRTLGPEGAHRDDSLLEQVSLDDVRTAIVSRLDALRRESAPASC